MARDRDELVRDLSFLLNGRVTDGKSIFDLLGDLSDIDGPGSAAIGLAKGLRLLCQSKKPAPKKKRTKLTPEEFHLLQIVFAVQHLEGRAGHFFFFAVPNKFAIEIGVPWHSNRFYREKYNRWLRDGDHENFLILHADEIKEVQQLFRTRSR